MPFCASEETKQERPNMKLKSVVDVYSNIAKSNPPWTSEEEREFVNSCTTKTGKWRSNAMKDRFVNEAMKHNLGLVFKIVNKMAFNKNEDVLQKAVIGMVGALKKYDPKRKGKISTWITNPIRWAIMQHQNAYAKSGTIAEEISALNHKFGRRMCVVSVDCPIDGKDGRDSDTIGSLISLTNLDTNYIIDKKLHNTPDDHVGDEEIVCVVDEMMRKLPKFLNDKELYVIKGVLRGKTQTDISGELHLSKVRISQIQATAFEKIRKSPMATKLKGFIR